MEWTEALCQAIRFIEAHLTDDIDACAVARVVYMSPFYFQKGFALMTGYTVGEYIRLRRLTLAALDIAYGKEKVIDIALKYGYQTPESFTKAFARFHGCPPGQMRGHAERIRVFLPLQITVNIIGGNNMDFKTEKMDAFKVIGFEKEFSIETSYSEIPKFWDEFCVRCQQNKYAASVSAAIKDCMIGEFGVCVETKPDEGKFSYLIAGRYDGRPVPKGLTVVELPANEWAKFRCVGPMPGALQTINTKIFREWLPGNPEYQIASGLNLEWYSAGDTSSADYESGIWLPVKRK